MAVNRVHMVIRAYISSEKTVRFSCPKCERSKIQDVSSFLNLDREIRTTIRCKCGHTFKAVLERRKRYRKTVDLVGTYWIKEKGSASNMVVKDISRTGIKFYVRIKPLFKIGDRIWVEFRLDNNQKTLISKRVLIKDIKDYFVGVEFTNIDSSNAADISLGFYLV